MTKVNCKNQIYNQRLSNLKDELRSARIDDVQFAILEHRLNDWWINQYDESEESWTDD